MGEKRVNTDSKVGFCINYGCAPEGLKNRQPHKSRKQSLKGLSHEIDFDNIVKT